MMNRAGTTVTADKRKGTVRIYKDAMQIMHFGWKQRNKAELEMDLMLFPGDTEAFMLPCPPATGRCFALRFKNCSGIHFFWMQEPKEATDIENIKKMNVALGNPDASPTIGVAATPGSTTPAAGDAEEAAALEAALAMSMSMGEGAATPAAAEGVALPSAPPPLAPVKAKPTKVETEDDEDAALAAALAMSMEVDEPQGESKGKKDEDEDADLYD